MILFFEVINCKILVFGGLWWIGGVKDKNGVDWIWENFSSKMVFINWGLL